MTKHLWMGVAILGIALGACDSDSTGLEDGEAVIIGSVQSAEPALSGSGPQQQSGGEASTVALGEVSGNGTFVVLAESELDAGGRFRIEGVPSGRKDLVIRALRADESVVGSVVLKEETRAEVTHRSHPINTRSTVHTEVWMEARTSAGSTGSMGAAELALFLDASAPYASSASAVEIEALAEASVQAQQAISAALTAHGISLQASERNDLLSSAAAERDAARDNGTGESVSQQTYIAAAFDDLVEGGVKAEAVAMAYAAAATAFARNSEGIAASTHLEVTREVLLLNVAIRKRGAASVESDPLGLKASAALTFNALDARIRGATGMVELQSALEEERDLIENRIVLGVIASLPVLGGSVEALIDTRTRTAVVASQLWTRLDDADTPSEMGGAVGNANAATAAAVADLASAVPSSAGTVSAQAATSLLLITGAGASME